MKELKDYHKKSPHQDSPKNCGVFSVFNAIKAKCNMKDIEENITPDDVMNVWGKPNQGFLLPLINSVKQFEDQNINGITVHNIFQGAEPKIGVYVDNLVTPVIAIKFGGRNKYKGKMAYTEKKGQQKRHIVCVVDVVDGDIKTSDSAYGDYSWIRKEDRGIIEDVAYFNVKRYKPEIVGPLKKNFKISQRFGENPQMYKPMGLPYHLGVDWATPNGTPVFSMFDGIAEVKDTGSKGYGLHVRIRGEKYEAVYAHLSKVFIKDGERVKQGTSKLGDTGSSGFSTNFHVHVGVRRIKNNKIENHDTPELGYFDFLELL